MIRSLQRIFAMAILPAVLLSLSCAQPSRSVSDTDEMQNLRELADVFYSRVSNRRFNSISTFHDPALREFFQSPEAFADYYADLADALAMANFEYNRPSSVLIEAMEVDSEGYVRVQLVLTGENGKPLRFWKTRLAREDKWERSSGRWWILPGKL